MDFSTRSYKITPLRSSTIKTNDQTTINNHFTYVTRSSLKRRSKPISFEREQETIESLCPSEKYLSSPNESTSSSEFSEPVFYHLPRLGANTQLGVKRVLPTEESQQKKTRFVPMGTRIHMHPRYKKTKFSDVSSSISTVSSVSSNNSSNEDLGPVCSIPLPNMFMFAPNPITIQRPTVSSETQTYPTDVQTFLLSNEGSNQKTPIINHRARKNSSSSSSRRSSGANMLAGLKTAFGSIRRAISADRLDQISGKSTDDESSKVITTPKLRQRVLMSPKKLVMNARRSSSSSNCTPIPVVTEETILDIIDKLNCHIVKSYPDGSKHIQLERTSLKIPFGFYISKDEDGIYVSKMGNSKNLTYLNGLVKVGDRLKFIQGIDGFTADVASIKAMVKEDLRLDLIIKTPKRL